MVDVVTKAAPSLQIFWDSGCWSSLGFEPMTSCMAVQCSATSANQVLSCLTLYLRSVGHQCQLMNLFLINSYVKKVHYNSSNNIDTIICLIQIYAR